MNMPSFEGKYAKLGKALPHATSFHSFLLFPSPLSLSLITIIISSTKLICPLLCQTQEKMDGICKSLVSKGEQEPSVADWEHLLNKEGMRAEVCLPIPHRDLRHSSITLNNPASCRLLQHVLLSSACHQLYTKGLAPSLKSCR